MSTTEPTADGAATSERSSAGHTEGATGRAEAGTKRAGAENVYRIERAMDDDGRLVVSPLGRRDEYEIVDYLDPLVAERLATHSAGERVRLELSRTGEDGGYVVTRIHRGTPGI